MPEETNESDWGKMTPEQQQADVDKGVEEVRGATAAGPDEDAGSEEGGKTTEKTEKTEKKETTGDGDETSAAADAAAGETSESADGEEAEDGAEDGAKEGAEESEAKWLDDDTRDFVATIGGLTEEDLAGLHSREELDCVLRVINRKAFEAGRAVLGELGGQQDAQASRKEEADRQAKAREAEQQARQRGDDVLADLAKFKLPEDFDEAAVKPLNAFVEAASAEIRNLRSEVAGFKEERQQEAAGDIRRRALDSLHSLGHKDLFGEPGKAPTADQAANIAKAIDAHVVHANGLFAMGRQAAPTPAFLKAAVQLAFGDQLSKQQQRQLTEKLTKQSAKRTGGTAAKTLPRRKASQSKLEEVTSDPEIDKLFKDLVSEKSG